jgi:hypothetical protein
LTAVINVCQQPRQVRPAPVLRHRGAGGELPARVFLAYATSKGRSLIDRELYSPKSWAADRDRCRAAKIPDDIEFATRRCWRR